MKPAGKLADRLTRTLIRWVGGVWLLCVIGVVWYVDGEINYNFDHELVEVSHRMFDIALEDLDRREGSQSSQADAGPMVAPTPIFADAAVMFQVVDANERVLLRSAETPADTFDVPLAVGFANDASWRIYTVRHPTRKLFLQVADPLSERRTALNRTLLGLIIPLVAVLPLLALLLRRIARRELAVLQGLSLQIAGRSGTDLSPIPLQDMPQELQVVTDHVNHLLGRLSQSLDVERALAANAAHELRTPLATALLHLQTALEHDLRRDDVVAALNALRTLSHRTEKLLQLSRAESSASLTRTPVDLVQLVATVAQEFWQQPAALHRLGLKVPDSGDAPVALGDVDALAIALRNLVENALRYAQGAAVEIEVDVDGHLIVRDFGPGVNDVELHTLQQRHVRHSAEHAGYGLGLSIVSTIVEKHGGWLELRSPLPGATHGFEARIGLQRA
ncbi:ATP-binding protein [Variovorax ginsengisoli]|uniref:histidine kinase n=1 Tax=Variovorax ginsengisoli TaxID=363844 RepID=A0ABT9S447_9BURK|nr:ATP-binding protein [Variovorax ginsengisoli]MDP9899121.1 two-component system OmpR family sensor kinase [Variovorax ginsengisoli]